VRTLAEGGATDSERLKYAVRRCLSRDPEEKELGVLEKFLGKQRERFTQAAGDPWKLLTDDEKQKEQLQAALPTGISPAEAAAWTALSRVVLNLDESITKE
jgi:hypothetical protein